MLCLPIFHDWQISERADSFDDVTFLLLASMISRVQTLEANKNVKLGVPQFPFWLCAS